MSDDRYLNEERKLAERAALDARIAKIKEDASLTGEDKVLLTDTYVRASRRLGDRDVTIARNIYELHKLWRFGMIPKHFVEFTIDDQAYKTVSENIHSRTDWSKNFKKNVWGILMTLHRRRFETKSLPRSAEMIVFKKNKPGLRIEEHTDELISPDKINKLVKACVSAHDKACLSVFYDVGCRPEELCQLRVKDVVIEADDLAAGEYKVHVPKVKTRARWYLVDDGDATILRHWLAVHPKPEPDAPLFGTVINGKWRVITQQKLAWVIQKAAVASGLGRVVGYYKVKGKESRRPVVKPNGILLHPYWFRDSRISFTATRWNHLELMQRYGQSSPNVILNYVSIANLIKAKTSGPRAKRCGICGFLNSADSDVCANQACRIGLKKEQQESFITGVLDEFRSLKELVVADLKSRGITEDDIVHSLNIGERGRCRIPKGKNLPLNERGSGHKKVSNSRGKSNEG